MFLVLNVIARNNNVYRTPPIISLRHPVLQIIILTLPRSTRVIAATAFSVWQFFCPVLPRSFVLCELVAHKILFYMFYGCMHCCYSQNSFWLNKNPISYENNHYACSYFTDRWVFLFELTFSGVWWSPLTTQTMFVFLYQKQSVGIQVLIVVLYINVDINFDCILKEKFLSYQQNWLFSGLVGKLKADKHGK